MSDWVARGVLVTGLETDKPFPFDHNGVNIGMCVAARVYFENGKRVAELYPHPSPEMNAINVRLMRAFYSIEARTQ